MLTLLSFIAVILIVVGVHELGHYYAARACGVRVLLFSIGFGKPFWAHRDKNDTVWALAPIPLGGYVQMFDADSPPRFNKYPDSERLSSCPHWKRIFIFAAGPLANFLLAFLVLLVVLLAPERGAAPIIGEVRAGSPAAVAGVQPGETITQINGVQTPLWKHAQLAMVDALLGGDTATIATDNNRSYVLAVGDVDVDGIADNGALAEVGIEEYTGYIKAEVLTVQADSPAAAGGLRAGDAFVAVNDTLHDRWMPLLQTIRASPARR